MDLYCRILLPSCECFTFLLFTRTEGSHLICQFLPNLILDADADAAIVFLTSGIFGV